MDKANSAWQTAFTLIVIFCALQNPAGGDDAKLAARVEAAIKNATTYLLSRQDVKGRWMPDGRVGLGGRHEIGTTALVMKSLLDAGVSRNHRTMTKGLKYLRGEEKRLRYVKDISLLIIALCSAGDAGDRKLIERCTRQLESAQIAKGRLAGLWDYSAHRTLGGDECNASFAIAALGAAKAAGISIDQKVVMRTRRYLRRTQKANGGFGYRGSRPSGSITAMAISTLATCDHLLAGHKTFGKQRSTQQIAAAVKWLGGNFSAEANPGAGANGSQWKLFYLAELERAARLSATRKFGAHDWYRAIASSLPKLQHKDGSFDIHGFGGEGNGRHREIATAFALSTLVNGNAPTLLAATSVDAHSGAQLIADHLSRQNSWPARMFARKFDLTSGILREAFKPGTGIAGIRETPVLLVTEATPQLNGAHVVFRQYLKLGGTLLFAAKTKNGEERLRTVIGRITDAEIFELPRKHRARRAAPNVPLHGCMLKGRLSIILVPASANWIAEMRSTNQKTRKRALTTAEAILAEITSKKPPGRLQTLPAWSKEMRGK